MVKQGDIIKIKVISSSKETGKIDFELVEEEDGNKKQKSEL